MGNFWKVAREGGGCGQWDIYIHTPYWRVCVLTSVQLKLPSIKLWVHQFFFHSPVNSLVCVRSSELQHLPWSQALGWNPDYRPLRCVSCLIRGLCFGFPSDLAPALAPQPRRAQHESRDDITTSGSHFPGLPQEQIRASEYETQRLNTVQRLVQCECVGALYGPWRRCLWILPLAEALR